MAKAGKQELDGKGYGKAKTHRRVARKQLVEESLVPRIDTVFENALNALE